MAKICTQWNDLVTSASNWLVTRGLNCQTSEPTDNENVVNFIYESRVGDEMFVTHLDLDRSSSWIEMFQYMPNEIPAARREAIAILFASINWGVHLGCFDIGFSNGRVRFRSGLDIENEPLSTKMLDDMHRHAIASMERYVPAIRSIAFADQSPAQAHTALNQLKTPDSNEQKWSACDIDATDWNQLPGTVCLQNWALELKQAVSQRSDKDCWSLVGHGALLEHKDAVRAKIMFQRAAQDAGFGLISVPEDSVLELPLGPTNPFTTLAPVMVYLEGDSWMRVASFGEGKHNTDSDLANSEFHNHLLQQLHAFDPKHPVVFVATAKDLFETPDVLRSVGAMDRRFSVSLPPLDFLGNGFIEQIGRNQCGPSLTDAPQKVGHFISNHKSDRTRGLSAIAMRRLARQETRQVEFVDLVSFCVRGTVESDAKQLENDAIRRHVAFHEAGHALIAMLDSNGENVPEYSSIIAGANFTGVVVESSVYQHKTVSHLTYKDFRHKIRISLAGRAAEQVYAGCENISTGATADLEISTRYATNAFANYGFAPNMDQEHNASSNLLIVCDDPSSSEREHIEKLIRKFLADEYEFVIRVLREKRDILDVIADQLFHNSVVDQLELSRIYKNFIQKWAAGKQCDFEASRLTIAH